MSPRHLATLATMATRRWADHNDGLHRLKYPVGESAYLSFGQRSAPSARENDRGIAILVA